MRIIFMEMAKVARAKANLNSPLQVALGRWMRLNFFVMLEILSQKLQRSGHSQGCWRQSGLLHQWHGKTYQQVVVSLYVRDKVFHLYCGVVGYTAIPTAILLTQQPADVGLSGYPSAFVSFTASVLGPQGEREEVTLRRHLVQLSFGDGVQRRVAGEEVFLHKYMVPMAMSFSARHGWPILQQPLSVCSAQLSQHINTNAFAELVSREHF